MSYQIIAALLFVATVAVIVAVAVVRSRWPRAEERFAEHEPVHEAPLDVLKRRYANGEITREEYERASRRYAA